MNKFLLFTAFPVLVLSQASGQVIQSASERESLLENLRVVVTNTNREALLVDDLQSPFVEEMEAPAPETGASAAESEEAPDSVEEGPRLLSDAVALRMVGQQFKPIGSLILGNRALLQLANGSTLSVGQSFAAEIQGNRYQVELESVSGNGYVLRLGTATLSQTFGRTRLMPEQ